MKTTKILCIGNSFSEDATTLLNPMLTCYGIDTLVVNLFIGGCSLEQHWENIEHAKKEYLYMKNGVGNTSGNDKGRMVSINEMILEEDWDIVTIQQSSLLSGLYESFFPEINFILEFIKKHVKKSCELYLHEPWSWESSYEWDAFEGPDDLFEKYYSKDDLVMYKQIEKTCLDISKVLNLKVIPSGNFIQFLRSFDEFNYQVKGSIPLSRDKRHMHELFGRYALSLLWAHTLFTADKSENLYYPDGISELDRAKLNTLKELYIVFKTIQHPGPFFYDFLRLDNYYLTNRVVVKRALMNFPHVLGELSNEFKNDYELLSIAVSNSGDALKYASGELRNDRNIVLKAINQEWSAFEFASDKLKNDREIVLAAVKKGGEALKFASDEYKNDREIVTIAVKQYGGYIQYASESLRNDRNLVLMAVKSSGFQYASDELRNDRDLVVIAINENGHNFQYASDELRNEKELVLMAINKNGLNIQYISEELRNDRDLVSFAISRSGGALEFASSELRNDRDLVLIAINAFGLNLEYASELLRNNKELVSIAVSNSGSAIQYASEELRNDRELNFLAVSESASNIKFATEGIKKDKEFIKRIVAVNASVLDYIDGNWKDDPDILSCIKSSFNEVSDNKSSQTIYESKEHNLQVALLDIGRMSWKDALDACENLGNGWALPNTQSLKIIRNELFLIGIGNIAPGYYWSSIELSRRDALYMRMSDGVTHNFYFQEDYKKTNEYLVRPVRKLTDNV